MHITAVPLTRIKINGDFLGPVIRFRTGQEVEVQVNNLLDFPTTTHWHGLDVDGDND